LTLVPVPFPAGGLSDGVVRLRLKAEADVEAIVEATRDPLIAHYTRVPDENTAGDVRDWLRSSERERQAGAGLHVLITDEGGGGAVLGAVSLQGIDYEDRRAEIGYWIAAPARGRGVATRAVRLIAAHGFAVLAVERISISAEVGNEPSCRVAERAGFKREAILRSWINTKGRQSDAVMFSLLRGELET